MIVRFVAKLNLAFTRGCNGVDPLVYTMLKLHLLADAHMCNASERAPGNRSARQNSGCFTHSSKHLTYACS